MEIIVGDLKVNIRDILQETFYNILKEGDYFFSTEKDLESAVNNLTEIVINYLDTFRISKKK